MCNNNKKCEICLFKERKKINEGTWAFDQSFSDKFIKALEKIEEYFLQKPFDKKFKNKIADVFEKLEKEYYNKIGDDILWDEISQAKMNFINEKNYWFINIKNAIERVKKLKRLNLAEQKKKICKESIQKTIKYLREKNFLKEYTMEQLKQPNGNSITSKWIDEKSISLTPIEKNRITEWLDFSSATPQQIEDEKSHYKGIKDLDVQRPMLKPKPNVEGYSTSKYKAYWDLYIQDEASNIMIDKYGFTKGYKMWQNSIDYGGAMYQIASNIANEKLKMLFDLKLPIPKDYFDRSYFDVWKQWSGKSGEIKQKPEPKSSVVQPNLAQNPANEPKSTQSKISYTDKDLQRVMDIVKKANGNKAKEIQLATAMANSITDKSKIFGRYAAAEDNNYHDIAKIFYDKV